MKRVLVFLMLVLMSTMASAQAFGVPGGGPGGGGGDPDPDPDPGPYTAPLNGFDWGMNDHFGTTYNGLVDFHWNQAAPEPLRWGTEANREQYDPNYVTPNGYGTSFDACPTQGEFDNA